MADRRSPRLPVAPDLSKAVRAAFAHHALQHQDELVGLLDWMHAIGCWPVRSVLEIGSHTGGTLACWAELVGPTGQVTAVDMPATCGLTLADFLARDAKFYKAYPQVTIILGNSHDSVTWQAVGAVLADAPTSSLVDLLFIDGDHSRWGVEDDYLRYRQFVRPGGVIAFHDTNESDRAKQMGIGVGEFVATLPDPIYFTVGSDWGGIGAVQVGV